MISVRRAVPSDAAMIFGFILALAEYERLIHEVEATATDVEASLFGPDPRLFCEIAELNGGPVGFAIWFYNYSTFQGRHGICLEDLFVVPQARGAGAGKALLKSLAQRCQSEGLGRLEWAVLDWNASSIAFYDSLGASAKTDWITRRLSGVALDELAGS